MCDKYNFLDQIWIQIYLNKHFLQIKRIIFVSHSQDYYIYIQQFIQSLMTDILRKGSHPPTCHVSSVKCHV